jgi:hypothetical protein
MQPSRREHRYGRQFAFLSFLTTWILQAKNCQPSEAAASKVCIVCFRRPFERLNELHLYRLEVENAEDDLVQKTEVAIQRMKTVLENPEPLKNLNELVKAQVSSPANVLPKAV